MSRGRRSGFLLCVLVLAAGCSGHPSGHPSGQVSTTTGSPSAAPPSAAGSVQTRQGLIFSKADAVATGDALLAVVHLPGATRVHRLASTVLGGVPGGQSDDPQQLDLSSLWTAAGTGASYLSRLQAHPPAGFTVPGGGPGSDGDLVLYVPLLQDRGLPVGAVTLSTATDGDHADLRVDVQESWSSPRSPATIIAPSVTGVSVDYVGPQAGVGPSDGDTTAKPAYAHRLVTGVRAAAIIKDLNALPPQTLATHNCVAGDNETANVTVDSAGHHLIFFVEPNGCQDVSVSLDGKASPLLDGTQQLTRDIYLAIGVVETPIPRVPPQGPPVRTAVPAITVFEHNPVQAQRVGDRSRGGGTLPQDAAFASNSSTPPHPPYTGVGTAVDRSETFSITGTVSQLVAWFRAHPAKGTVAAEPLPATDGVLRLVMEPKDRSKPVQLLRWVSMVQHGTHVVFRLDAQTAWKH